MIVKTLLTLAIMTAALAAVPAMAWAAETPLRQWNSGVPLEMIVCAKDSILLESPYGRPACAGDAASKTLQSFGYLVINPGQADDDGMVEDLDPEYDERKKQIAAFKEQMMTSSEPSKTMNYYPYELSNLPAVGETATLNYTGVYKHSLESDAYGGHPKMGMRVVNYDEDKMHICGVVSNIESDDPDVFVPYTSAARNVTAELGRTYTILAKIDVLKEGFIGIGPRPIVPAEDGYSIQLAVSEDDSIYLSEYLETEETYLDHTIEVRAADDFPTCDERPDLTCEVQEPLLDAEPKTPEQRKRELETWYTRVASGLVKKYENLTLDETLERMRNTGFHVDEADHFLRNHMNFTDSQVREGVEKYAVMRNSGVSGQSSDTFDLSSTISAPLYFS